MLSVCRGVLLALVLLTVGKPLAATAQFVVAQEELQSMLPPSPEWHGASTKFALPADHEWATTTEASGFTETATYQEVMDYARRLAEASPEVDLVTLTTLANGERMAMLRVSRAEDKSPAGLAASARPTVLIEAGIHPGESMGVNAGLMLVRDMTVTGVQAELLDKVNLLFVPIVNVAGYLRQSETGRINQHGPNTSGRRPGGRWLNLNRDFGKLDSPEIRAIVKVMTDYDPAFFIDAHSTNGQNYQYDVTWCDNGDAGLSSAIFGWLRGEMTAELSRYLSDLGHVPGPCIDGNDKMSPEAGYYPYFSDGAAYSSNYADHRHIPAYLLELHSLKPYRQRVLGAYAFFAGLMGIVGDKASSLRAAIEADRTARIDPVPIAWDYDTPAPQVDFASFAYEIVKNQAIGIDQIVWSSDPVTLTVEQSVRSTALNPVARPSAYYVPAVWTDVIERLRAHGIELEVLDTGRTVEVERYRMTDFTIDNPNREGRATAKATPVAEKHTMNYRAGDVRVATDQPLGNLAVALLEPTGESSFFYWGFFNTQMNSHEYGENYIVARMAEKMLAEDPSIAEAWAAFREQNPDADNDVVVEWFFERTAFYDSEAFLLPVGVERSAKE
jgi:hypothetical protein